MCETFIPIEGESPNTNIGRSNGSQSLQLITTPLVTAAAVVGQSCNIICLFENDDDADLPSPIQVSSVVAVNAATGDPIPGFGTFKADREARQAGRRLLRTIRLPIPKRRLAVFAFSAPVLKPITAGQANHLKWEVKLCGGARREDLKRSLEKFHGWILGGSEGKKFHHHVSFTQIEDIQERNIDNC